MCQEPSALAHAGVEAFNRTERSPAHSHSLIFFPLLTRAHAKRHSLSRSTLQQPAPSLANTTELAPMPP